MQSIRFVVCLIVFLPAFLCSGLSFAQRWSFTSGKVSFSIRNAGMKVEGSFSGLKAMVDFPESQPETARIQGSVEVSGIQTGIGMRDRHLKGKDYFDAAAFPHISMNLQKLEKSGNHLSGLFLLRMKGTTKEFRLPVQFNKKSPKVSSMETSFTLNRLDFGIGSSSWTLGDEVAVRVVFELQHSGEH